MRTFYYGRPMIRRRRRLMFKSKKFKQRLCHQEKVFIKESIKETHPHHESPDPIIMFIGDRGFGIRSTIKGFQRVGGPWKGRFHSSNARVFITNEYNSSQTCLHCFKKLSHTKKTKKGKLVTNNGSFICYNPACIARYKALSRDRVSAMAIGIAGLSQVLFGVTVPEFDPHPTTEKSRVFNEKAVEFRRKFQT